MKNKIVIISTSYPYGSHETFLENEVKFLSNFYDIHIIPIINEKTDDEIREVPINVSFSPPILNKNQLQRFLRGFFNLSPFFIFFPELLKVFKNSKNLKFSLYRWYNDFLIYRALLSNTDFLIFFNSNSIYAFYFYWGIAPVHLLKTNHKLFIRVHGGEIYEDRNFGYITFKNLKFIPRSNTVYLPISEVCKDELQKISSNLSIRLNRLGVYNNGLNPENLEMNTLRIVSCSTLIPLKRVNLIVEALYKIEDLNIHWVHFGDGPLLGELRQQVKYLNGSITPDIKGRIPNKSILKYYAEVPIDLFINVSETEGVPVSIMEALSFGIPCFATNVGGTGEIINDSVGKLVDKQFNPTELVTFLRMLKNKAFSKELRLNSRKRWDLCANAEVNYKDLVEILGSGN